MKINIYFIFYYGVAGGYKLMYQYANYLANLGYDICIYYDIKNGENKLNIPKNIMYFIKKLLLLNYPYYYKLSKKIKQKCIYTINDDYVRDADISICTSPYTANCLSNLSPQKGKKIYFIQGHETWTTSEEEVNNTYKLGMKNIVISKWLKELVVKQSKKNVLLIPNGLDLNVFKNKHKQRNKHNISLLYHYDEIKGFKYAYKALLDLKEKYPDLRVNMYGSPKKPSGLPKWFKYYRRANQRKVAKILNNSNIFICSSLFEGFGLAGLEAMACGCCLVTTNCYGPLEYANDKNSIICNCANDEEIYKAVDLLLSDEELKKKLVTNANATIKSWSIENSFAKLENALKEKREKNEK